MTLAGGLYVDCVYAQEVAPHEVHPDRRVTFRLDAPKASTVTLWGDFIRAVGGPDEYALSRNDKGVWSVTVGPLPPDLYICEFYVNAVALRCPMLRVPSPQPLFVDVQRVPHGTVHVLTYESKSLGQTRRVQVYTPPGYEESSRRYSVLYLLHPGGGTEKTWSELGQASVIFDNLLSQRTVEPMLVVMPFGYPLPAALPDASPDHSTRDFAKVGRDIVEDVLPLIDSRFRTLVQPRNRAIAGASLGGMQALTTGFGHHDKFGWVGAFSGLGGLPGAEADPGFDTLFPALKTPQLLKSNLSLLWLGAGSLERRVAMRNVAFSTALQALGIQHTYVESPGFAHEWRLWRGQLRDFTALLFHPPPARP